MGRLKNRLLARLFTRFPRLLDRSVEKTAAYAPEDGPSSDRPMQSTPWI